MKTAGKERELASSVFAASREAPRALAARLRDGRDRAAERGMVVESARAHSYYLVFSIGTAA